MLKGLNRKKVIKELLKYQFFKTKNFPVKFACFCMAQFVCHKIMIAFNYINNYIKIEKNDKNSDK